MLAFTALKPSARHPMQRVALPDRRGQATTSASIGEGLRSSFQPPTRMQQLGPLCATLRFQEFQDAGTVELPPEVRGALEGMLGSESMCGVVAQEAKLGEGVEVAFTGLLFQPVPWSPSTPKGMPQEYEQYNVDDRYVIINVPPQAMFKAKCFKPSRLCAVYKRATVAGEAA